MIGIGLVNEDWGLPNTFIWFIVFWASLALFWLVSSSTLFSSPSPFLFMPHPIFFPFLSLNAHSSVIDTLWFVGDFMLPLKDRATKWVKALDWFQKPSWDFQTWSQVVTVELWTSEIINHNLCWEYVLVLLI